MEKIELLAEYISNANPNGVAKLARENGFPVPRSKDSMPGFIYKFLKENGEEGFLKLTMIHPDREMLLASVKPAKNSASNFVGQTPASEVNTMPVSSRGSQTTNILLVVVILLIVLSLLTR
jgi:hypothetical protein